MHRPTIAAIILAAGRGARMGSSGSAPKQYQMIDRKAVIAHTIEAFLVHEAIEQIVCVIHADDHDIFRECAADYLDKVTYVTGGPTRQQSTLAGLQKLSEQKPPDYILIHDAARPFVTSELLDRIINALDPKYGILPTLPVSDTIKRASDHGVVIETLDRSELHAAQTPQAFPFATIFEAHVQTDRIGRHDFTDDSAIAEWAGIPVRVVEGSAENVKLTWSKDIEMADLKLSGKGFDFPDVRIGSGYDVHVFDAGDHLTLCGVDIPHDRSLSGHSDADVGLHALTDALFGTCGSGDIGSHFPPSDPNWKGAASHIFLSHAAKTVRDAGGRIANADLTIIAEAPKIGPHREAMVKRVAEILGIEIARVSVKATTNEKMGFIGRGEGIAAIASVSVVFPGKLPE